jgi:hypothetical protein
MKCAIAGNQSVTKICFSCMRIAFVMAGFASFFGCHFWFWKAHLLWRYQSFKNPRYFGTSCGDAAMLSFWICNQQFSAYQGAATINPLATRCDRKIIQKKHQKGIIVTWITGRWLLLDPLGPGYRCCIAASRNPPRASVSPDWEEPPAPARPCRRLEYLPSTSRSSLLIETCYSLWPILLFANTDVSTTKMCLRTSILAKDIMGQREYLFFKLAEIDDIDYRCVG